eukprot:1193075-Prorocentrum_minimum.AAC.2
MGVAASYPRRAVSGRVGMSKSLERPLVRQPSLSARAGRSNWPQGEDQLPPLGQSGRSARAWDDAADGCAMQINEQNLV